MLKKTFRSLCLLSVSLICLAGVNNSVRAQDNQHDNGYGQQQTAVDSNTTDFQYQQDGPEGQAPQSSASYRLHHYFVGGNLIASFGDGGGAFGLNPSIGYSVNQYVDVGVGINAVYNYNKDYYYGGKWRTWNLGIAPFARIYPVDFLFFEASFEENLVSMRYINSDGVKGDRQNYTAPSLIGAIGYANRIFGRSNFFFSVGMDFLNNKNSPYRENYYDDQGTLRTRPTAIIRTGFNFNLW